MGQGGNQYGVSQPSVGTGVAPGSVNPYAALGPNPYSWLGNWMGSQNPNFFGFGGGYGQQQQPNISSITGMTNQIGQTRNQILNGPDMAGGPDISSLVRQVGNRQGAISAAQGNRGK